MTALFETVLRVSLSGGVVIAAVLALRLLLKRVPKKYICLLWLLAALRLLLPFEIESAFSLQPDLTAPADTLNAQEETVPLPTAPVSAENMVPAMPDTQEYPGDLTVVVTPNAVVQETHTVVDYTLMFARIWLAVAAGMLLYTALSWLRLRRRVRDAVILSEGVWVCGNLDSAFVLGFFRPQVYLNPGLTGQEQEYVLAHERCHIRRGDHWWKLLGFVTLAVHWFNPLVWLGYLLLCRDLEMACDEAVVKHMEVGERKAYSAALLSCSAKGRTIAACPVAFGEVSVKSRIQNVLNYRKPKFWVILAAVVAVVVISVCFLTSPVQAPEGNELPGWVNNIDSKSVESIVAMGYPADGDNWFYELNEKEMTRMLRRLKTVSGTMDAENSSVFDYRIRLYIAMEDGTVLQMENRENHSLRVDGVSYTVDEDWLLSWPQSGDAVPRSFHIYCGNMATVAQLTEQEQALLNRVTAAVDDYRERQETSFHMTVSYENTDMDDETHWYVNGDHVIAGPNWGLLKKDGTWFERYSTTGYQWRIRQSSGEPYILYIDPIEPDMVSEINSSSDENGNTVIVITSLWGERGNGLAAQVQWTYTLNAQGALTACVCRSEWYDENGDCAESWPQVSWQLYDTSPQEIRDEIDRIFAEVDTTALSNRGHEGSGKEDQDKQSLTKEEAVALCREAMMALKTSEELYLYIESLNDPMATTNVYMHAANGWLFQYRRPGWDCEAVKWFRLGNEQYIYGGDMDENGIMTTPYYWQVEQSPESHDYRLPYPFGLDWENIGLVCDGIVSENGVEAVTILFPLYLVKFTFYFGNQGNLWYFDVGDSSGEPEATTSRYYVQFPYDGSVEDYLAQLYEEASAQAGKKPGTPDDVFYEELFTRVSDGAYAEMWAYDLFRAFYANPEAFVSHLAGNERAEEITTFMGYSVSYYAPYRFAAVLARLREDPNTDQTVLDMLELRYWEAEYRARVDRGLLIIESITPDALGSAGYDRVMRYIQENGHEGRHMRHGDLADEEKETMLKLLNAIPKESFEEIKIRSSLTYDTIRLGFPVEEGFSVSLFDAAHGVLIIIRYYHNGSGDVLEISMTDDLDAGEREYLDAVWTWIVEDDALLTYMKDLMAQYPIPDDQTGGTQTERTDTVLKEVLEGESMEFAFLSGAGAWRTTLTLDPDGTFSGVYWDSEMGNNAPEYPNGSVYYSALQGKFGNIRKVNEYTYAMTLESLTTEQEPGEEWIQDDMRFIACEPYGLEGGLEFLLYLPDTPVEEVPEEFLTWWPYRYTQTEDPKSTLSCYGILNVAMGFGFFSET